MKNILITRPANKNKTLKQILSNNQLQVFSMPLIETVASEEDTNIEHKSYDFTIFTSGTTVDMGLDRLKSIDLGRVIAVGEATAEKLRQTLLKDIYFISENNSIDGVKALLKDLNLNNKKVFSPGGLVRLGNLRQFLESKGATADMPVFYRTKKIAYTQGYLNEYIKQHNINGVVLCSPSAVLSLLENIPEISRKKLDFFALGASTWNSLKDNKLGGECGDGTIEGLASLIRSFYNVD